MVSINFYDEIITVAKPQNLTVLKQLIQREYAITKEEVEGLILLFDTQQSSKQILTEKTYTEFISQQNPMVVVTISLNSRLYQENQYEVKGPSDEIKGLSDEIKGPSDEVKGPSDEVKGPSDEVKECNDDSAKLINKMNSLINAIDNEKKKHDELVNKQNPDINEMKELENAISKIVNDKFEMAKKKIIEETLMTTSTLSQINNTNKTDSVLSLNNRSICNTEHINVKCQGCNMYPIKGFRYLCTQCKAFNYCESCENKLGEKHQHPFMKIRFPLA